MARSNASYLVATLLAATLTLPATAQLTLDGLFAEGSLGRAPKAFKWSSDGRRLAYRWADAEGDALWTLNARNGRVELLLRPAQLEVGDEAGKTGLELDDYHWSPRGNQLLLESAGDLFLYAPFDRRVQPLTRTGVEEKDPEFSPDGRWIAFVREGDLWIYDLRRNEERRLTRGGEGGDLLSGTTDWLYWEELWGRRSVGYWWAPNGKRIAYYRFDERAVDRYPLVDERSLYPAVRWQRYPTAGRRNPTVHVGVLELESGDTVWLDTGDPQDSYLARVVWHPDGERLAVLRLNRDQNRLDLLLCSATDGACDVLLTESAATWVNVTDDFRFLEDGRFLWSSERGGRRQLYLYSAAGQLLRRLTPERVWALDAVAGINEDAGVVGYTFFGPPPMGALERWVGFSRLDGSESWVTLPPAAAGGRARPGWSRVLMAPRGNAWLHSWSDAEQPPRSALMRLGLNTEVIATLPWAPPESYTLGSLPRWEFLAIPGPQGEMLPAAILRPPDFDPGRRYPVIMYHYGCPGSQVVQNRWPTRGHRDLWHRMMAERGFVVFMVDNRASRFFGKEGEDLAYRRFGELDLAAQLAGVAYLRSLPFVEPERIGLWGWSGGGSSTLYDLFNRPGTWRAAVAGAPVTDWRLYDTIWTERYLDDPQRNGDGYRLSSPLTYATQLRDPLLVVHGTADDNVHPQNTLLLSRRLVEAGIPFEQAIYPGQKHGFKAPEERHFLARMTAFFERHLRP